MMTTKASVLAELSEEFQLTPVLRQKLTAADFNRWEVEAAKAASYIKMNQFRREEFMALYLT